METPRNIEKRLIVAKTWGVMVGVYWGKNVKRLGVVCWEEAIEALTSPCSHSTGQQTMHLTLTLPVRPGKEGIMESARSSSTAGD